MTPDRPWPRDFADADQEAPATHPPETLLDEPADLAIVFGRYRDHHRAGFVWHRDDREGHADPPGMPQRWWSHNANRWTSWLQIRLFARDEDLHLVQLRPDSDPTVHQVCGAIANVMRTLTPDTPEWRTARLCFNAALQAAGIANPQPAPQTQPPHPPRPRRTRSRP